MSNGCTSVGKYDPATGLMSFELALDAMKRGKKVKRIAQENSLWWIVNGRITYNLRTPEGFDSIDGAVFTEDLLAEDWIEVV